MGLIYSCQSNNSSSGKIKLKPSDSIPHSKKYRLGKDTLPTESTGRPFSNPQMNVPWTAPEGLVEYTNLILDSFIKGIESPDKTEGMFNIIIPGHNITYTYKISKPSETLTAEMSIDKKSINLTKSPTWFGDTGIYAHAIHSVYKTSYKGIDYYFFYAGNPDCVGSFCRIFTLHIFRLEKGRLKYYFVNDAGNMALPTADLRTDFDNDGVLELSSIESVEPYNDSVSHFVLKFYNLGKSDKKGSPVRIYSANCIGRNFCDVLLNIKRVN